jgi:hypothetical protein
MTEKTIQMNLTEEQFNDFMILGLVRIMVETLQSCLMRRWKNFYLIENGVKNEIL